MEMVSEQGVVNLLIGIRVWILELDGARPATNCAKLSPRILRIYVPMPENALARSGSGHRLRFANGVHRFSGSRCVN